jgi:hypothetical protein
VDADAVGAAWGQLETWSQLVADALGLTPSSERNRH